MKRESTGEPDEGKLSRPVREGVVRKVPMATRLPLTSLRYKAEAVGIQIEEVSERNSSKCCSTCGKKGSRCKRGLFKCTNKQCSEYGKLVNADLNGARNLLNRYLRMGLTARKVLVGALALPKIKRWNFHTWDSHKWQLRNRVSPSLRNLRPGNRPLVESHVM